MLLKTYTQEIFRSKRMPGAHSIHCYAHLDENIEDVLPFLNAELVKNFAQLDRYRWCGHGVLIDKVEIDWQSSLS
ncbi:hypothetical protein D1BOALGB6SA_10198 [Olavius sp. associated proteobacterium Delta 1]|nr:hypothetical protein D1BOALGB6SA_10198 [Olavius sp. associated proteobacterium Delta 1]